MQQIAATMIVPLRVEGAANEWCIVELQGEIIPNDGADMKGAHIGSLWYENGVPTVRIGNHIVTGKVTKLPKPFAILEKHSDTENNTHNGDDVDMDGFANADREASDSSPATHFDVIGIARTRIIFSSRPKPVLT